MRTIEPTVRRTARLLRTQTWEITAGGGDVPARQVAHFDALAEEAAHFDELAVVGAGHGLFQGDKRHVVHAAKADHGESRVRDHRDEIPRAGFALHVDDGAGLDGLQAVANRADDLDAAAGVLDVDERGVGVAPRDDGAQTDRQVASGGGTIEVADPLGQTQGAGPAWIQRGGIGDVVGRHGSIHSTSQILLHPDQERESHGFDIIAGAHGEGLFALHDDLAGFIPERHPLADVVVAHDAAHTEPRVGRIVFEDLVDRSEGQIKDGCVAQRAFDCDVVRTGDPQVQLAQAAVLVEARRIDGLRADEVARVKKEGRLV